MYCYCWWMSNWQVILLFKLQLPLSRWAYAQAQDLWSFIIHYAFDSDIAYVWWFSKITVSASTPPIQDWPAPTTWFKNFIWQSMVFIVFDSYGLPWDHASGLFTNNSYDNYDLIPPPLAWGLKVMKVPLLYAQLNTGSWSKFDCNEQMLAILIPIIYSRGLRKVRHTSMCTWACT